MSEATSQKPQSRIYRSPHQWRDLFSRFEQSGQTRDQFCLEQGVSLSSFSRWRTKLKNEGSTPRNLLQKDPVFVELQSEPIQQAATESWDVELQLGADVVLRLRRPC